MKYNAIEFDLPVGAIFEQPDGSIVRHIGGGKFVTPIRMPGYYSVLSGVGHENADGTNAVGKLVEDPLIDADSLCLRVWLVEARCPNTGRVFESEKEMIVAIGGDYDKWLSDIRSRDSETLRLGNLTTQGSK